jgi:hypothetical protein
MLRRNFLLMPTIPVFAKLQERTSGSCWTDDFIKIKQAFITAEKQFGKGSIIYLRYELYKFNKDNINICLYHRGQVIDRVIENVNYELYISLKKDFDFWLKEREK